MRKTAWKVITYNGHVHEEKSPSLKSLPWYLESADHHLVDSTGNQHQQHRVGEVPETKSKSSKNQDQNQVPETKSIIEIISFIVKIIPSLTSLCNIKCWSSWFLADYPITQPKKLQIHMMIMSNTNTDTNIMIQIQMKTQMRNAAYSGKWVVVESIMSQVASACRSFP